MRYIGSKVSLLAEIEAQVPGNLESGAVFCDIFSGTGVVGHHFKHRFTVYSNDQLYFSYVIQKARIELNRRPEFSQLVGEIGSDPIKFLNEDSLDVERLTSEPLCFLEFSPGGPSERRYLTEKNALRIDAVRQTIEEWRREDLMTESEYFYLLASVVSALPSVSNIAGTYGAYLKHWDPRTSKRFSLDDVQTFDNGRQNRVFNADSLALISTISGDVLYIDPPYNSRQYLGNYHLLETVARYDYPRLFGKSGVRQDTELSSRFCKSREVAAAFESLLSQANFNHVVISYSNEGLLPEEELVAIVERYFDAVGVTRIPYRRYARVSNPKRTTVQELLIVGKR